jgi:hypothetical protein
MSYHAQGQEADMPEAQKLLGFVRTTLSEVDGAVVRGGASGLRANREVLVNRRLILFWQ